MSKFNILQDVFPDAKNIFTKENATLEDSLKDGLIVLDTNTLLFPFNVNKQSLQEIITAYNKLVNEKRLFVPSHVAREFAKNRATKLGEIYSSVGKMSNSQKNLKKYPILSDVPEYQEIVEYQKSVADTEKKIRDKVKVVLDIISEFERNDPVSSAYSEIFNEDVVFQHKISNDDLEKDFKNRIDNKIPPGYKDGSKPTNPEGDYIIWQTILELGEKYKKDLIFISSDGKPDWQYNVEKSPFQPRYELIDEYRRKSSGKSFHIAPLSQLLEMLGTPEGTVQRIERLEHTKPSYKVDNFSFRTESLDEQLAHMKAWFLANYEPPENNLPYESREGGYFYIWGGPFELEEVIVEKFGNDVSDHLINICCEEIEDEYGDIEWSAIPQNDSLWVDVYADYEKCNEIGAAGMFQVIGITDENGNDLSHLVDSGEHFNNLREVLSQLSSELGINVDGDIQ